jgi:hypothetical protein
MAHLLLNDLDGETAEKLEAEGGARRDVNRQVDIAGCSEEEAAAPGARAVGLPLREQQAGRPVSLGADQVLFLNGLMGGGSGFCFLVLCTR